jgi:hypothetical protein
MKYKSIISFVFGILCCSSGIFAQSHPCLLLTGDGVAQMKKEKGKVASFDRVVNELTAKSNQSISQPIVVPVPKDAGGGFTHEQHKANYYAMYHCGLAYQLTDDMKYARYVINMLKAYAKLYPTLGYHPVTTSEVRGRLFWQTLNESVWLVHTSIAYDCVKSAMTDAERRDVEKHLFYPMSHFIMDGNEANHQVFNKMHNHGTWATTAVGMIGMAMGDSDLVDKALYGSDKSGKNGGFIRQLNELFSPDGYFTEGAYYQRYAIWPFVLFAQCIDHYRPQQKIFEYRDCILLKAVKTLLQLSYDDELLRFNDALQKGFDAQELVYAVDIMYHAFPQEKSLLSVASQYQHTFLPCDAGYAVARDIAAGQVEAMKYKSCFLSDGKAGDKGGIALIRSNDNHLNSLLTLKATSHGLSHGHFDKLTMAYYDNDHVIFGDYGAVRWLNIEAKDGGGYTHENETFAKQTIAHNTLVVDQKSDFDGKIKVSSNYHPIFDVHDFSNPAVQVMSAIDSNAYVGVRMRRTLAYVSTGFLQCPLILDIIHADSDEPHVYDLPYWYQGQLVSTNFHYQRALTSLQTLGDKNGYQYIWNEGIGANDKSGTSCFTFICGNKFYSVNTSTDPSTRMYFLRLGANDGKFNLRSSENAYMLRTEGKPHITYASSIESHGVYDLQVEQASNLQSACESVSVVVDTPQYTVVKACYKNGHEVTLCIANEDKDSSAVHSVHSIEGLSYQWKGVWNITTK